MPKPCAAETNRTKDALDNLSDAEQDFADAAKAYDDAGGFLDDSTFWDVAGVATGVVACLSNPVGWVVCGGGIIVGGVTIVASEKGRHDEIEAAEQAYDRANSKYWTAMNRYFDRLQEELECASHARTKRRTP